MVKLQQSQNDGCGFETYPERCGYPVDDNGLLQLHQSDDTSNAAHIAFIQAWLFFGLLQEIFEPAQAGLFSSEDFVIKIQSFQSDHAESWTRPSAAEFEEYVSLAALDAHLYECLASHCYSLFTKSPQRTKLLLEHAFDFERCKCYRS